jgi:hypothetical protein
MIIDNSNRKYRVIIAGILLLVCFSIVLAYSMGVSDTDLYSGSIEKNASLFMEPSENKPLDDDDVPLDQTVKNPAKKYVEQGDIQFVDDSLCKDDLPVCLTPCWAGDDEWVVIKVLGGYTPTKKMWFGYEGYGFLEVVDSNGNRVYNTCPGYGGMFVGWILDEIIETWTCVSADGCYCDMCWVYYNFSIDPFACDNWICLESSYDMNGHRQDHKYYELKYKTHWTGCEFDYITAHKNQVPESLLPRLKNHRQIYVMI